MTAVWQLRPNWVAPYSIAYALKTDIIVSRSGREQRRALRQTPRKTIRFRVSTTAERFRVLKRTMVANQGKLLYLAQIQRGEKLTAISDAGASAITLPAVPGWIGVGTVLLLADGDRAELRTVNAVTDTTVTFEESNTEPWSTRTRACPALKVRTAFDQAVGRITTTTAEADLTFDVDPGSQTPAAPPEPPVTWNGREVFLKRANWNEIQDLTLSHSTEVVDYELGRLESFQPISFGAQIRAADYVARNRAEAQLLLDFYLRCMGRRGEFYVPSDEPDLILGSSWSSGSTDFLVRGPEVADAYTDDLVHKSICVLMKDGRRFYRSVTVSNAEGDSMITADQGAPYTVTPATVRAISWMPVCRLASDEITIEWLTDEVARTRFTYLTLEALDAE